MSAKAQAPKKAGKHVDKDAQWKSDKSHLFSSSKKDFAIGRAIQPKRDLSRFVKWPLYVRIQRQKSILVKRIKVPAAINQFTKTLEKNQASNLLAFLKKYRTESKKDKATRLKKKAADEAKDAGKDAGAGKPRVLKFGLNHVTSLVESKKAKLVVIAHDVDPIELVVWLPTLCRKMDVPFCIIKGKARLGYLCHKKTASCVAVTDVNKEHLPTLQQFCDSYKLSYNDSIDFKKGGGFKGVKAEHAEKKRLRMRAAEAKRTDKLI
jgi:large subunit ribosomal protein L7Ae